MFKNLTPRSIAALAVVAASSFLLIVLAVHGGGEFANARAAQSAGFAAHLSGWLVQNIGAGVWALVLVPMAWGVIVYFEERTPDLLLRFVGTLLLAFSISTIAGLLHSGLWAGHVGNAAAGALGGLSARMGGFGTALAFLISLTLFAVSLIFATDWMFHALRRAGRDAAAQARPIATQPPSAELLDDPAESEPREFVQETPRAAVAAAEMDEIVEETAVEASIPAGWDETEDEGRTIIASPGGYRGVEFLPTSDELAVPGTPLPRRAYVEPTSADAANELFHDDEFVATSEVAFSLESPGDVTEAETQEIDFAAQAGEEPEGETISEAVQALFEAVTTPPAEPAAPVAETAPVSGIGLPDDSPFHDEFFASDAGWPYAAEPSAATASDGASAANEIATSYSPATNPSPEPAAAQASAATTESAFEDQEISIDEILVSRLPAAAYDDSVPAAPEPVAERAEEPVEESFDLVIEEPVEESAPAVAEEPVPAREPESEPQLSLFTEAVASEVHESPASASAVATLPVLDLTRLHSMELDPLFHDAVNAVLERGRASAVVLQRQLGIGYARGIRILDQMTAAGLAGPDTPSGSREIRVSREAWTAFAS